MGTGFARRVGTHRIPRNPSRVPRSMQTLPVQFRCGTPGRNTSTRERCAGPCGPMRAHANLETERRPQSPTVHAAGSVQVDLLLATAGEIDRAFLEVHQREPVTEVERPAAGQVDLDAGTKSGRATDDPRVIDRIPAEPDRGASRMGAQVGRDTRARQQRARPPWTKAAKNANLLVSGRSGRNRLAATNRGGAIRAARGFRAR